MLIHDGVLPPFCCFKLVANQRKKTQESFLSNFKRAVIERLIRLTGLKLASFLNIQNGCFLAA